MDLGLGMRARGAPRFPRLEGWPQPLAAGDVPLAGTLASVTSGINKRRPCDAPSLDAGSDAASRRIRHQGPRVVDIDHAVAPPERPLGALCGLPRVATTFSAAHDEVAELVEGRRTLGSPAPGSSEDAGGDSSDDADNGVQHAAVDNRDDGDVDDGDVDDGDDDDDVDVQAQANAHPAPSRAIRLQDLADSGATLPCSARLMLKRELGLGDVTRFTGKPALPLVPMRQVDNHMTRCYIGQFSRDGSMFVVACQDHRVLVYDADGGRFSLRKEVRPRGVRWTITETCTSPDQRYLLYASIHPTVHLVDLAAPNTPLISEANVTEVHEELELDGSSERFGIWSIRWSRAGDQLLAGTNIERVYVYDMAERKVIGQGRGHLDDVNAVEYLDDSPAVFLTGSDDNTIKLWDTRTMGASSNMSCAGVFVGHTEGITHLNTRGDGKYFISNAKDQTVKLWDVRKGMLSENQAAQASQSHHFRWDYRWMSYPGEGLDVRHPHDASLMTYRGHTVTQTLIRAYFSPAATTGQRFIYAGSSGDNAVRIWDVLTGQEVARLQKHAALVRDVSWHPTEPLLVSVSWDGRVISWAPAPAYATGWTGTEFD